MALGKGLGSLIPSQNITDTSSKKVPSVLIKGEKKGPGVWKVSITKIIPNKDQPRRSFPKESLQELIESIKQHGIIQPLTVCRNEDGTYGLIAGERRYRAAQEAGLQEVPVAIRDGSEQEKFEWALIENIQRQDLNPIEEAKAYERLLGEFELTQQEIATRVGKSRPSIANILRLLTLPEGIQTALIEGSLSMGKARALLSLKDTEEQLGMFKSMLGETISVRELEETVAKKAPRKRRGVLRRDPNLLSHERVLEDVLNTKVRVTQRGERGTIVLHYYSLDELKRLLEHLRAGNE